MTGSESGTLVVELGAGTGVVTEALLARGIPPQRLIAIERSPALANLLRERFPEVRVVCGDAAELGTLLQDAGAEARRVNVVSSLPLRSLPPSQVRAILGEIAQVLRAGGHWIQYTYALAQRAVPLGFQRCSSAFVWRNLPPARVDVFACAAFA